MQTGKSNEFAFTLALIGAALYVIAALIFTFALFASLCLTVLCLFAWNKPLRLFGNVLTPEEAREFVGRGLLALVLIPSFVLFASIVLQIPMSDEVWPYLIFGSYTVGSLSLAFDESNDDDDLSQLQVLKGSDIEPAQPAPDTEYQITPEKPASPPFRFATWDDEEELRK
ncbi:hypothetical protein WYO_5012 [Methylobacterium sp. GXF4]|uniref:hypothetical protein n=1 Tax=Methylobacterium sp. GXF4 TaxID=1096546 RepID=UPI00026986EB|nr:hypothetical protein [Methylobacterium sp. GXF4]EIZ82373.1 hypothetical protein WYO_5012 [Methylobacterium sp. GXF4]